MDVRLPKLGEGAESGTVVSIMVKEGDSIAKGQTVLELENEKAVAAIPSSVAGKVRAIRVKEGDQISVGQVIMTVEEKAESPGKAASPTARARPVEEAAPQSEAEQRSAREEALSPVSGEGEPSAGSQQMPAASPTIRKISR